MTQAQQRLVQRIKDGAELIRAFDVWGGYWWYLRPSNDRVNKATVAVLVSQKVLLEGKNVSIYSGYQEMPYSLNPEM